MVEQAPKPLSEQLAELRKRTRDLLETPDGPERDRLIQELAALYDAAEGSAVHLEQREAKLSEELAGVKEELVRTHEALITDPLTGLFNRKGLELATESIVHKVTETGQQDRYGVLVIDLCLFKSVNDTFGHPVGDIALKEAADRMRRAVREKRGDIVIRRHSPHEEHTDGKGEEELEDALAREGGDEYVFLIHLPPDAAEEMLVAISERVQQAIDAPFHIEIEGKPVQIPLLAANGYAMVETIPLDSKLRVKFRDDPQKREERLYFFTEDETKKLIEMPLSDVEDLVRKKFVAAQERADARMYVRKQVVHEKLAKYDEALRGIAATKEAALREAMEDARSDITQTSIGDR